jgi:AcrR family transcriptional regulator
VVENEKISKNQKIKDELYNLALKEFMKSGVEGTSMRHLAKLADMSLGRFYYYYPSKEAVIQRFYEESLVEFAEGVKQSKSKTKDFGTALASVISHRIKTYGPYRELLIALSKSSTDPRSELSPFTKATSLIRESAIANFRELLQHFDVNYDKRLEPYLANLLWMYSMGVVLFWVFDESKNQQKTWSLIDNLTPLISRMIKVSGFTVTRPVVTPVVNLLKAIW